MNIAVYLSLLVALGGLGVAFWLYATIIRQPAGNARMIEISDMIHTGAMAFLKREYTILAGFIVAVFLLL
ncbi:MAG: sodium/proton-translocating pyrophosphatase, partial [Nitrospinae bacterium]|nr:sodium/proton-translocating pyrophosphatase [Nitrospinota bacterium]